MPVILGALVHPALGGGGSTRAKAPPSSSANSGWPKPKESGRPEPVASSSVVSDVEAAAAAAVAPFSGVQA